MRVTSSVMYNQILQALQSGQADYSVLTERLATGKKILAPSDDTLGALRAMDFRVTINSNDQYQRNITGASSNLNITSTVLSSAYDTLGKIVALAQTTLSGTDVMTSATFAKEASDLRNQLLDLGNTKIGDRYLFSGFRSNVAAFAAGTYAYQGDSGVINAIIGNGAAVPINVSGDSAFSYTPGADYVKQLANGLSASYTHVAGTQTVNVALSDATGTVVDNFSFSNVIQMTDLLSSAIGANNTGRVEALMDPFTNAENRLAVVQADVGVRLSGMQDQSAMLTGISNSVKDSLDATETADINETAMQLQQTDTALQALRATATKVLSQSLFDFLK